jgi:proline iminopeptidase
LGCGKSDRPNDPTLWQTNRFVEEIKAVEQSLRLKRVHILGYSWGSVLAVNHALIQPTGLTILILASPCLNLNRYLEDVNAFRKQLPAEIQVELDQHEVA